jgi:hypothetical protein
MAVSRLIMLRQLVLIAGIGQLALALASLAVPGVLGWRAETAKLRPLTRQVFWTYAGYIGSAHVAFGLLSALAPHVLIDGSTLAGLTCAFIAAWWGVRLALQFFAFDRRERPPGAGFVLAEVALVAAFIAFTAIYSWAAWRNLAA